MRSIVLAALLLVPALAFVPTSSACWTHGGTTVPVDNFYVTTATEHPEGPARVRSDAVFPIDLGVELAAVWLVSAGAEVWEETNGIPGLQSKRTCAGNADLLLGGVQAAVTRQIIV